MRKYSNRVLDVLDIYDAYIDQKNAENTEDRYKGREHWYGASSSGLCSRKLYYKHVMRAEETNEVQTDSKRLMRLGTIVHDDIQNAINNSINSSLKNTINNDIKYYIEEGTEFNDVTPVRKSTTNSTTFTYLIQNLFLRRETNLQIK